MRNYPITRILLYSVTFIVVFFLTSFFLPWQLVSWGRFKVLPGETITVTGEAKTQLKNQVAIFSAGVSEVSDNKDKAISEVNQKVEKIIEAVKAFGIPAEDIKTQNLSVYQQEETYSEEGRQKSRLGQWRVNNTIEVKLKEIEKAGELADLLTQSGANNVYGPSFSIEETTAEENALLGEAIKNAQTKAETIAKAGKRRLGKILNVTEGNQTSFYPLRAGEGLGGAAPVEPGSQTIQKTVTVTFEVK